MDNGWSKAIEVGKLPGDEDRPVVVDMDPAADPVLFWAGKRNKREIPVLPLQRNEVVSESRIGRIIERARRASEAAPASGQMPLFADLERSLREGEKGKRVEFYTHEEGWRNKLISGDSLHVIESLIHYEGMRGKVQMIYIDPPYGIDYDSNFQQRVDSTKNEEKDRADDVLTIKAFQDTWALGVHSYLSYLEQRLYLCRELLAETGSIFIQIGDANVHLVRSLGDEVFGRSNYLAQILFQKSGASTTTGLEINFDYLLWYARDAAAAKPQPLYLPKYERTHFDRDYCWIDSPDGREHRRLTPAEIANSQVIPPGWRRFRLAPCNSQHFSETRTVVFEFNGKQLHPGKDRQWSVDPAALKRVGEKNRLVVAGNSLMYKLYAEESPGDPLDAIWTDTAMAGLSGTKWYVVQTNEKVVTRCMLLATSAGDIVFDPTCA
jgi:adenine-specific DNA-methyltransferase